MDGWIFHHPSLHLHPNQKEKPYYHQQCSAAPPVIENELDSGFASTKTYKGLYPSYQGGHFVLPITTEYQQPTHYHQHIFLNSIPPPPAASVLPPWNDRGANNYHHEQQNYSIRHGRADNSCSLSPRRTNNLTTTITTIKLSSSAATIRNRNFKTITNASAAPIHNRNCSKKSPTLQ